MIGLRDKHLGLHSEEIRGRDSEPVAARTKLGWIVYGTDESSQESSLSVNHITYSATNLEELHQTVKDYFTTENFGVKLTKPLESKDEERARIILENTTKRIGSGYETGLLWRHDIVQLPESRSMAIKRLLSVEQKMARDSSYAAQYIKQIDDYCRKGYAHKLIAEEVETTTAKTWYLPHFSVINPNKPGKFRVVFDAAAFSNGVSLNAALLTGSDQLQSLPRILHQFRMGTVAICGDIAEMFCQIKIRPDDKQAQRFLWRRGDKTKPIDTYVMDSMTFGASCSPCSAHFVKNHNAREFSSQFNDAAAAIIIWTIMFVVSTMKRTQFELPKISYTSTKKEDLN